MVKAQHFSFVKDSEYLLPKPLDNVRVSQHVARVGRTSMTLGLSFHSGENFSSLFAYGFVVMVCVANGKAQPFPEHIVKELNEQHSSQVLAELLENSQSVLDGLKKTFDAPPSTAVKPADPPTLDVLLRSSDEDNNLHVNHRKYAQFFEDMLLQQENGVELARRIGHAKLFYVEYLKECHRGEWVRIHSMAKLDENDDLFQFTMVRKDEVVCKGLAML